MSHEVAQWAVGGPGLSLSWARGSHVTDTAAFEARREEQPAHREPRLASAVADVLEERYRLEDVGPPGRGQLLLLVTHSGVAKGFLATPLPEPHTGAQFPLCGFAVCDARGNVLGELCAPGPQWFAKEAVRGEKSCGMVPRGVAAGGEEPAAAGERGGGQPEPSEQAR